MKELDPFAQDKEQATHAHHKEKKLVAKMPFIKGLILYELDEATRIVRPAEFTETFNAETNEYVKTVVMNPGCTYRQFLNIKNAVKKFSKYI